jgi:cell division protein FtsZ
MNEIFDIPKDMNSIIKVIGVGGGGSNAVNFMFNQGIKGVDFVVCNTDRQALDISPVPYKIQLGKTLTEGRGAGMLPEVGMNAAFENIEDLREILSKNTKMVFVTAGMGGGTGTGAAPVIAQVAKELGILTVGIVTLPFDFEGKKRRLQADEGLERLRQNVDTLLVINNEKLRTIGKSLTLSEAFQKADNILTVAAKGIAEVIADTGVINVDFNDVNTVLRNSGRALMGSAVASGEGRDLEAVKAAMNSPLLNDHDIHGAKYVLLNITYGDKEVLMDEIMNITDFIQGAAGESAEVIWGHGHDSLLGDNLSITIVATGFSSPEEASYVLPERKVMDLDEEQKKEITVPMSSPFESNTMTETLDKDPYLKPLEDLEPVTATLIEEVAEPISPEVSAVSNEVKFNLFDDESPEDTSTLTPSLEWEVQPTVQPTFDFSSEPMASVTPVQEPVNTVEPGVIRHQLDDDTEEAPKNYRIQSTVLPEEIAKRNEERAFKIQEITSRIQNAESITEYESQPAYLRRNIEINSEKPSQENNISRFGLSGSGNGDTGLRSNSYLHDNVD